jgi:hypothetical protein
MPVRIPTLTCVHPLGGDKLKNITQGFTELPKNIERPESDSLAQIREGVNRNSKIPPTEVGAISEF